MKERRERNKKEELRLFARTSDRRRYARHMEANEYPTDSRDNERLEKGRRGFAAPLNRSHVAITLFLFQEDAPECHRTRDACPLRVGVAGGREEFMGIGEIGRFSPRMN